MTPLVLDASAGVELALQTPIGRRLEPLLPTEFDAWVPEHYFAECLAVLRRDELSQRYPTARIASAVERVLGGPLRRVSIKPLTREAWRLRGNLTIADALYVVVARHLDCELVTVDQRLANAPGLPVRTITP